MAHTVSTAKEIDDTGMPASGEVARIVVVVLVFAGLGYGKNAYTVLVSGIFKHGGRKATLKKAILPSLNILGNTVVTISAEAFDK